MRILKNIYLKYYHVSLFIGAIYLVVIAGLPILFGAITDLPSSVEIGGTSLLIVVGVAIETAKQIQTKTMDQKYRGFIK